MKTRYFLPVGIILLVGVVAMVGRQEVPTDPTEISTNRGLVKSKEKIDSPSVTVTNFVLLAGYLKRNSEISGDQPHYSYLLPDVNGNNYALFSNGVAVDTITILTYYLDSNSIMYRVTKDGLINIDTHGKKDSVIVDNYNKLLLAIKKNT